MRSALVTGGVGFIGSHLVRELLNQGISVRVLDNLSSGCRECIEDVQDQFEFLEGDICDAEVCRRACRDVEVVFHLAALVSVSESVADPVRSDAINTGGTLNLLVAARDMGVRRFVLSSSAAIYGDTEVLPVTEDVRPAPQSPYGVQKLVGEHYARCFTELYGLETVSLRYFNVYGPGQSPLSEYAAVIPRFLTRLLAGQAPTVYGDGEQTRDFCAVQDVVAANLRAAVAEHAPGGAFNIAGGARVSLNQLLAHMRAAIGVYLPAEYKAVRPGDIRHSMADITLARNILGYEPSVGLEDGLRQTAAYYRSL